MLHGQLEDGVAQDAVYPVGAQFNLRNKSEINRECSNGKWVFLGLVTD